VSEAYCFDTNEESRRFCDEIAGVMVLRFSISLEEAVERINRQWRGAHFVEYGDIRYHESADYWANRIYYRDGTRWWLPGEVLLAKPAPD